MSSSNNRRRKQDHQRPRAARVIIWTPLALCKSVECLTTRFGARAFAATPPFDKHIIGAHKDMMVFTEGQTVGGVEAAVYMELVRRREVVQF